MLFELSSASEVMQKRNGEIFGEIPGVHVIADYIVIAAPTEQQQNVIFKIVLDRARQKGQNPIQSQTFEYMGNLVT